MRLSRTIPAISGLLALALASCTGNTSSGAPRVATIPEQSAAGAGGEFTVDLGEYVTDGQGDALSLSVVGDVGSFTGTTFTGVFPTFGTYVVEFDVSDGTKTTRGSFIVEVTSANLAIVQIDSAELLMIDTNTGAEIIIDSSGHPESIVATIPNGCIIFERTIGSNVDLFCFDAYTRRLWTIGNSTDLNERHVATTTNGRVFFTTGEAGDRDLWTWNSETSVTKPVAIDESLDEYGAVVSSSGLVFYEVSNDGNVDVYYYDPSEDESTAVATEAGSEVIQGVLTSGAVVFSRPGDAAESDLFHFSTATGVQEIGLDQTAIEAHEKTLNGTTNAGLVVFTSETGGVTNIWLWDPTEADSTQITGGTSTETNTFNAVTSDDIVIFTASDTTNGGNDIIGWDTATDTATAANAANVTHTFEAVTTVDGETSVVYSLVSGGATQLHIYNFDDSARYSATAASYRFDAILGDGKVALTQLTAGGGMFIYDPTDGTFDTVLLGVGVPTFGAVGPASGDVVFELTRSSQTDLFFWDDSEAQVVTFSDGIGEDAFGIVGPDGATLLFTRVVSGNTNTDVYLYDVENATSTRLTAADEVGRLRDHTIVSTFQATRD